MKVFLQIISTTGSFIEIGVLLFISFVLGFFAAKIPIPGTTSKKNKSAKKITKIIEEEEVDPRDVITEPTTIKAVLTRDRKGNAIAPTKAKDQPKPPKE